jgi:hypothetical protein
MWGNVVWGKVICGNIIYVGGFRGKVVWGKVIRGNIYVGGFRGKVVRGNVVQGKVVRGIAVVPIQCHCYFQISNELSLILSHLVFSGSAGFLSLMSDVGVERLPHLAAVQVAAAGSRSCVAWKKMVSLKAVDGFSTSFAPGLVV